MITAIVFASIAGVLHIAFFFMESIFFEKEQIHYLFGIKSSEVTTTRVIFFNQGFYNLFLSVGTFLGIYFLLAMGQPLLLQYVMAYMFGAALVLFISNRTMYRASLIQGVAPLVAFIFLLL